MTSANESAYPHVYTDQRDGDQWVVDGITKRELFAAMAMQGLATVPVQGAHDPKVIAEMDVKRAVIYADALIAELSK